MTEPADTERRAPVQGERVKWPGRQIPPATVSWDEHVRVWEVYAKHFGGSGQSAERVAERGGFGLLEIIFMTGAPPKTWRPR